MVKPKALLLTTGGHFRLPNNQTLLEDVLVRQAGLQLRLCDDHSEMNPRSLARYDLILDYSGYATTEPADDQLGAVMEVVEKGTPYVGLHVASLPFRNQLEYRKRRGEWPARPEPDDLLNATQLRYLSMVGSAFVTHSPIKTFSVKMVNNDHAITQGVTDFEVVDELYQVAGDRSRLEVLAEAEGEPLLYVARWGKGKVHYNALGHDQRTLASPSYQRLLVQAVAWALAD